MTEPTKDFIQSLMREAGKLALDYYDQANFDIQTKTGPMDLVTDADLAVSEFLVHKIHEAFPDHAIHSEEMKDDINPGAEWEWVIDPIDGTGNFAHHVPLWCNILGVERNGEAQFGAVYNPIADTLYFAEKGKGAWRNDQQLHVNTEVPLSEAKLYSTVAPSNEHGELLKPFVSTWVNELGRRSPKRVGNMLPLCFVASGAADVVVQNTGHDHDFVGTLIIAEEAGAIATDLYGNPWKRGTKGILVAAPQLHAEVLDLIHKK